MMRVLLVAITFCATLLQTAAFAGGKPDALLLIKTSTANRRLLPPPTDAHSRS